MCKLFWMSSMIVKGRDTVLWLHVFKFDYIECLLKHPLDGILVSC